MAGSPLARRMGWDLVPAGPKVERRMLLRSGLVLVVAVWLVTATVHCGLLSLGWPASHPSQPLPTSLGGQFAINVDHPYLVASPAPCPHVKFVTAVVPRVVTALVALGVAWTVLAVTGALAQHVVPAGRDPPVALGTSLTGQDLLTRFCVARR